MKSFFAPVLTFAFLSSIALQSCSKCESCYLIEEIGGTKVETSVGQICGEDKIQEKESEPLKCNSGACYYECR